MKKIKFLIVLAVVFSPLFVLAQWDKYFENKGLRIDYTHSGRVGIDYFIINHMSEIPYYSASHKNLIDKTDNGAYLISMYEKNSQTLIFSKGVSSLFNEWLSMDEATKMCGNFEEVIIVPCPKREIETQITFSVRDSNNVFYEVARYDIDPDGIRDVSFFSKKAKPTKPKTVTLNATSRPMEQRVDLVLIPVGYTIEEQAKMKSDLQKTASYIIEQEPYKSLKDKIEITGVERYARQSGIPGLDSSNITYADLGVCYNTFSSPRYIMTRNLWEVYDVVDEIPCDAIIMICNSDTYGGGGIYNYYATCYMGSKTKEVIVHEFSHSFAGLGDEYSDNDSQSGLTSVKAEPYENNITTLVDFSKKWGGFIDKDTPIPTPCTKEYEDKVGVYQGASYQSTGFYRPYQHCMMRDLYPFCPVCTKSIIDIVNIYSE